MTDADAVIENFFIEHGGMTKEEIAAYNREYYLRTRKLKNRVKKGDVPQPRTKSTPRMSDRGGDMHRVPVPSKKTVDQIRAEKRRKFQKQDERTPKRIEQNEEKIRRARQAARKLPQDKRNVIEKKLDSAEKKLKGLKKKLGNPFNNEKTVDRSGPVKRVPPSGGSIKGPSKEEQARVKAIQDRVVAANKAVKKKQEGTVAQKLERKLDKIEKRLQKKLATETRKALGIKTQKEWVNGKLQEKGNGGEWVRIIERQKAERAARVKRDLERVDSMKKEVKKKNGTKAQQLEKKLDDIEKRLTNKYIRNPLSKKRKAVSRKVEGARKLERDFDSSEVGKFYKEFDKGYDRALRKTPGALVKLGTSQPSLSNAKKIMDDTFQINYKTPSQRKAAAERARR